ncbi:MAG: phospholipid/cholesterol/gamma-HCH transport system substrate-binding protein [Verrucomicrobiales bacterium]|jgi:phospholipid/cholesterol/gamma-HCH transport system substrate-binding protein
MNRKRAELLVGLFLFVGLCLLAGMILKFGNFGDSFRPKYSLELRYPSAGGLLQGSEVKFSGVTIGRVSAPPRPNADSTGAIIELSIFKEYPVPKESKISIESAGFLGDSYVAITPPKVSTTDYLKDGESVAGTPSGGLSALADSAGDLSARGKEVVDDMRVALSELNSALSKLDTNILAEDNLQRFNETVVELSDAIKNLNTDVLGDENIGNLKVALTNFRITSENLVITSENFVKTSENLVVSSEKVSPILDKVQSAVDKAEEGIADISAAARNANVAIQRVTDGPGLLAALINDGELREDFEAFISNLRDRGVLRYRDEEETSVDTPNSSRPGIFRNR